ncbi:hypothetical protein BYT27DRAFT_6873734 [Phlegmacium glaucopus]|nr:hypothetical protein BYT27DRAFT_6873734 [Phlegmacium glaucopus]
MVGSPTMPIRMSSSPTPTSSLDHSSRLPTSAISLLNTSELICFDPEVERDADNPHEPVLGDAEPLTTLTSVQQKTSPMDVDTPTPTQPPKPVRRMLFKPVHPLRRNQPTTSSSVQDSTPLTSDSAKPFSTSPPAVDGHPMKDQIHVDSRQDDIPLQEKPNMTRPRPSLPSPRRRQILHEPAPSHALPIPQPLPTATQQTSTPGASKSRTPTPPSLRLWDTHEVKVQETRASLLKDEDCGNATDPDAELVVNLLLHGTPEEPNNPVSKSRLAKVIEDSQLHAGHEDEEDEDDEPSVSEEDTAAIEGLATQFLQRYLQLFDVDRLKLEAAYAKNALFSCRVHHVQEPSFSMAGLFAPESREGLNVSPIQKGGSQIVNRLLELGPHSFCPRGVPRTVDYDVVPLSSTTGGGILLTVHGVVVNPHLAGPEMDHILSVDQSFVLRKRGLEDDEGMDVFGQPMSSIAASNLWPLIAVCHQMTVRDAAPLPLVI